MDPRTVYLFMTNTAIFVATAKCKGFSYCGILELNK